MESNLHVQTFIKQYNCITNKVTENSTTLDTILRMITFPTIVILYIIHLGYLLLFLGLFSVDVDLLHGFNVVVELFIVINLILRFHPFRKHVLNEYDGQLIFASMLFSLESLGAAEYSYYTFDAIRNGIYTYIPLR